MRGKRFIYLDEPGARNDPFGRHAAVALAQARQNGIFNRIERREIEMPAFGRLHMIAAVRRARYAPRPSPVPGPMMLIVPSLASGTSGPHRCGEMLCPSLRHGMAHRPKIIDQSMSVDAQLLVDQRRADDPGIVGELDHVAADRPGNRDRAAARGNASPTGGQNPPTRSESLHAQRF